jgi:DNA-binding transcriptional LysR family regulator
VRLFDRSARFPVLTDQGRALLADARAVAGSVELFKARAKSLAGGVDRSPARKRKRSRSW